MLDDTDKRIIARLNENGRESNNQIARELGVSEGTIRNRIKRLTDEGHLAVSGHVNPDSIPGKELVTLGANVARTKDLCLIAEEVFKLEGVQSVYITSGRFDLMVEVWLDVKFGLIDFLSKRLAAVEGIVSTESFLVVKSYGKWINSPGFDD